MKTIKIFVKLFLPALALLLISNVGYSESKALMLKPFKNLSEQSQECAACHKKEHPSLYNQWGRSKHFGANVGCYECHAAEKTDPDAIQHEGHTIAVIVSPKDCANCHKAEVDEFTKSHHAKGGEIIGSLDNMLAEVVQGALTLNGESPAAVNGCWQCHGSEVKVLENGDLDPTTWPNTGIGRINPDGSRGACTACHQRHEFSMVQARRPEACGKCHLGPDHPQKEIYEESKHGINFYANVDRMNLDSSKWVVGEDYDEAPTCATCHMSATDTLPITHDVGDRISWTLRPAISEKIDAKALKQGKKVKSWEDRRKDMEAVCQACHSSSMVESFYMQFDSLVELYNNKFAKPGKLMMDTLKAQGLMTDIAFDEKIEWTWFYLWHHEGRRARHGAAMMAPDYVQWHGLYEVAERFYMELIPEYNEYIEKAEHNGKTKEAETLKKVLAGILESPEHQWFSGKEPAEVKAARKKAQAEFQKRYANESK
ncbi:multiheme c-type cytochrome [Teredinibacter sp. KSP-S5-2]|uniref:multiheme c-type cytochrome n=1 Tax=Teredinibacter sp. KSP-S5-2 TaxID=3034506 RepID=UPI00293512EC|nr:multiheme c-type cytochrome [Teredinibacter sp. KSP-S5-2]WNO08385.1 multiheme c-type cytochrome [Teredinibacter sp. KSP-S5-2]